MYNVLVRGGDDVSETQNEHKKLSGADRRELKRERYWKQHSVKRRGHCVHCDYEPKDFIWLRLKPRTGSMKTCCPACRGVQPWSA